MQLKAPSGGFFFFFLFVLVCKNHSEKLFCTKTNPVKKRLKLHFLLVFLEHSQTSNFHMCICGSQVAIFQKYEELEKLFISFLAEKF